LKSRGMAQFTAFFGLQQVATWLLM